MKFFNRDKPENDNIQISQSIIDFVNQNASEEPTENDLEDIKTRRSRNHLNLNLAGDQTLQTETLDTFQRSVKQDILRAKPKHKNYNNLTKEERLRLKKLRDNPHIVIKMDDKGSAVVVMNTIDYLREGYRQLHDDTFYQKIDNDITSNISDKITQQLLKMRSLDLI